MIIVEYDGIRYELCHCYHDIKNPCNHCEVQHRKHSCGKLSMVCGNRGFFMIIDGISLEEVLDAVDV